MKIELISKWKQWIFPGRFSFGEPPKKLHKYFYVMKPLTIPGSPLQVRNWVVANTKWTSDREQYGVDEQWPQSVDDLYNILQTGKEDCDGLAILTASVLSGNKDIRLATGYYGIGDGSWGNHVYCLLIDSKEPNNPWLIETTGDDQVSTLPRLKMNPLYKTKLLCDVNGNYWEINS